MEEIAVAFNADMPLLNAELMHFQRIFAFPYICYSKHARPQLSCSEGKFKKEKKNIIVVGEALLCTGREVVGALVVLLLHFLSLVGSILGFWFLGILLCLLLTI